MPPFDRELAWQRFHALVDSIPRGRVATYGQIAREAGLPRHARHVGAALRGLPADTSLPWHRVVNGRGEISARPGKSMREQRRRLRAEGVRVDARGRLDLSVYGWLPEW